MNPVHTICWPNNFCNWLLVRPPVLPFGWFGLFNSLYDLILVAEWRVSSFCIRIKATLADGLAISGLPDCEFGLLSTH